MNRSSPLAFFLADAAGFVAIAIVSLLLGLGVNLCRAIPLSPSPSQNFPEVSLAELEGIVHHHSARIIDARPSAFFASGHVPGAISLSADELGRMNGTPLPFSKDDPLVIYCDSISCPAADSMARQLEGLGYHRISIFPGGWQNWRRSGLPAETGP